MDPQRFMIVFGDLVIFRVFIFCFFIFYIFLINFNNGQNLSNLFFKNLKNNNYSTSFIAHAGGGIDGEAYTNSLEAVEKSIANSYKLIELDLLVTDDKKIVAQHDFNILGHICKKNFFKSKNKKEKKKILYNDISDCDKIFDKKYTLLKEEKIISIFENNKNLILVTDKIRDYKLIREKFKFENRVIVEVFNIKDYFKAKFYGIKNPMFLFTDGRRNIIYSIVFNIKLISISTANTEKYNKFLQYLLKNKVSIFSFSSNSSDFNKKYIGNTITGVYTDFWNIKKLSCTEIKRAPDLCKVY